MKGYFSTTTPRSFSQETTASMSFTSHPRMVPWRGAKFGDVTGTTLGIDSIAEFQTLTGTYSAQYAGNGGAIVGVTKSGTNEFHGSAYEFLRNSDLDTRGFFDPGSGAPPFRRNQYGGTFGGPIKKNKIFFFMNYEGIQEFLETTSVNYVPNSSFVSTYCSAPCTPNQASLNMLALYPSPNGGNFNIPGVGIYNFEGPQTTPENFGVTRVDWNISDKDAFFARYEADFGNRTTNSGLGLWPLYDQTHNQFLTLGERHVFSPAMVNQFTASYSRPVTSEFQPAEHAALQIFDPAREDAYVAVPNLTALGAGFVNPFQYLQNKFTEKDDLTWIKGGHTFHIGGMFQRQQLNPYVQVFWNGFYVFSGGIAGCATADQCFLTGNPLLFEGAPNGGTNSYRSERYDAVQPYFQDDWKVTNRLTINLGFRYDWETNPIETHGLFTNVVGPPFQPNFVSVPHAYAVNPSDKNFDPRIGLAWDVFGDHKTSLRAGFGIFHDPYTTYDFSSAYVSSPPFDTELQFFFAGDPNWPKPFVGAGSAAPSYSQTTGTYYGTNTTPYSMEYSLSIQRELPWNNLLTVGYQGTKGVHLLAFHDFNAPVPTVINGVDYFATQNGGPCALGASTSGPNACTQNARPVPALGSQDLLAPTSYSSYNGLQVGLTHRAAKDLVYQLSYTWSHCIDSAYSYGGLGFNNVTSAITNPYNWSADKGPCSFDLRQNLTLNAVYVFPFKGNRWKEGWQISGITTYHTGVNFSLGEGDQADLGNTFDTERPNVIAGCNLYANQSPNQWFNPACFTASTYGTVGNAGRNMMVGPGYAETDISVTKITRINERMSLQLRAEIFNIFNHPNFSVPGGTVVNPSTSCNASVTYNPAASSTSPNQTCFAAEGAAITSLVGSGGLPDVARQTQFSAKVTF